MRTLLLLINMGSTAELSWLFVCFFFFSSRRRHTRFKCDWSSDVCSSDLVNFHPAFRTTPFVSILLTLQIVPYFMTGFESVPKVAEEAHPGFRSTGFFRAILMAVLVGAGFHVLAVAAVAHRVPRPRFVGSGFATP